MNNENIYVNKNESRTESAATEQQPWTRRMFNWMYNETPKSPTTTMDETIVNQRMDEDPQSDDDDLPRITVNSPSLDVSTEFSSTR